MERSKSIFAKKVEAYDKLKDLLSKNLGYIGKFTEYLFEENIKMSDLESVFKDLIYLKNRSINIDISNLKFEALMDKIQINKEDLKIKELLNKFPSEQKNFAKLKLNSQYNSEIRNIMLKIADKDHSSFISKISRYKSSNELENAMKIYSKDAKNDRESILSTISTSGMKIIIDDNNLLIISIPTQEDIKKIGSDTSWCIVNSTSLWISYTKNRHQFVIINFNLDEYDPKFKIGMTLDQYTGDIHAAHDIMDYDCKGYIKDLLSRNKIDRTNLIPETNFSKEDASTIKASWSNKKLEEIFKTCEVSKIDDIIRKIIEWGNKSNEFIIFTASGVGFIQVI
jgi:hypothetical protein